MKFKYLSIVFIFFTLFLTKNFLYALPLVDSNWLSKNICRDNIKVIEIGKSYNSYKVEHINCSIFTNFYNDGWRANFKGVNMALPNPEILKKIIENLAISNSDHIILYPKKNDKFAMAEVTSIYFTFKFLGHEKISILNGGYPKFKKNYPLLTEDGEIIKRESSKYEYNIDNSIIANSDDITESSSKDLNLIDSRESDFYLGINKLKDFENFGTLKGATNIPSMWNLESRGLNFNNINILSRIHNSKEIEINSKEKIFFCYAGLESSLNWFVSHELLNNEKARLYEGSIFDWSAKKKMLHSEY